VGKKWVSDDCFYLCKKSPQKQIPIKDIHNWEDIIEGMRFKPCPSRAKAGFTLLEDCWVSLEKSSSG
jgi:hypothetical protein